MDSVNKTSSAPIFCGSPEFALKSILLQIICNVALTRLLVYLFKPFRQPRVTCQIIVGILLGPSVLGNWDLFRNTVFDSSSIWVLDTMSNIGLLYFMFLVGLEVDLHMLRRTGNKALVFAICSMIAPFLIGTFLYDIMPIKHKEAGIRLMLGTVVSLTAFPVLTRVVAELKLLNTELGRLAMSTGLVIDIIAWFMFSLSTILTGDAVTVHSVLGMIGAEVLYVSVGIFIVRPAISWVTRRTPEGESCDDLFICLILVGVIGCGYIANGVGVNSICGAFLYGVVIPNGPLTGSLIEKLEDFVSELLLPLFFANNGLKTDLKLLHGMGMALYTAVLLIIIASAAKIGVTLLLAFCYKMSYHEGIALGLLLNTKGLTDLVILYLASESQALDGGTFAIMIVGSLITTGIITPITMVLYNPTRRFLPYKRRTVQSSKPNSELQILVCIYTPRSVQTIINLLEASHPTKNSPIHVCALHLVELTNRESTMLLVHSKNQGSMNRAQLQSNHIIDAFHTYEQHAAGVSVTPLAVISSYPTMQEDICILAEDKRIAFIILPFHKHQTVDGVMEITNSAYRTVNQNVLANAPCSVGILVDRGLGGSSRLASDRISHHVVVLFFGGPDDREALSYASRMVDQPGISLKVIRFLPDEEAIKSMLLGSGHGSKRTLSVTIESDREQQKDDDIIKRFQSKTMNNEYVTFEKRTVKNAVQTVAAIRSIDSIHDLYIVGKGQGASPLTIGLMEWSECPELGGIGDILASSDFPWSTASILVVQQYRGLNIQDGTRTPDSSGHGSELYSKNTGPATRISSTQYLRKDVNRL